jgi:hypothetical protein
MKLFLGYGQDRNELTDIHCPREIELAVPVFDRHAMQ